MAILITFAPHVAAQKSSCAMKDMQQEKHVAGYTLRTFLNEDSGDSCVQILRNGAVVHQETNTESFRYTLGQQAVSEAGVPALADGIDLTGNGYPNVIVTMNTRGAHCCLTVSVYELSAKPKRIAELKVTHTEYPYFKKGSDGVYRFYARDWSLAYWPSSFSGSPSAPVVLRYTNHGYHLDLDAMRTPRPSLQDMQHAQIDTKELFQDFDASQSGLVWAPVMQWITVATMILHGSLWARNGPQLFRVKKSGLATSAQCWWTAHIGMICNRL
ncbi:MAG: hypothetical protein V4734_00515 [Terriglobus sp.]